MQSSIRSRKEIKTFWKKFEKLLLVVHLSFSHGKQLLMKLFFENQQTYANLLLGLTLANYNPTRCVKPCRPVFIRVGFSIQKRVDSYLDNTRPSALKISSSPISNEQDQNKKLKASLQQADRKKNDSFSVDGFCSHCNTVFEDMGCFYHFCPCHELRPSLTEEEIQRGSRKRELDALRRHYILEKGLRLLLKCGSANGGDCTKQPILLNNISLSLPAFTCS